MTAGCNCAREIDFAEPDETVQSAAKRMHDHKVGTLLVVDADRKPIGIITDRDLTVRVLAEGRDATGTRVADVMTADPRTIREETPIGEALVLMRSGVFRRLPVVDDEGCIVGILSLDDIIGLLCGGFGQIRELIAAESPDSLAEV